MSQALQLAKAIKIAAATHSMQLDKGGNAYILHPIRLMMRLRTDDEELMQIAILHDVIEDSKRVNIDRLKSEGFSKRVIDALLALTHIEAEPYEDYIKNIGTNRDATLVKLEDLRDNSDITRLKGIRPKDLERVEKYHKSYVYLMEILKLKKTRKLIMAHYSVKWEIDIEANSPEEAAKKAGQIQRRRGSIATIFDVTDHCTQEKFIVDTLEK